MAKSDFKIETQKTKAQTKITEMLYSNSGTFCHITSEYESNKKQKNQRENFSYGGKPSHSNEVEIKITKKL